MEYCITHFQNWISITMSFLNHVCVIHFEGKEGEIKRFTQDTLAKIIESRKEWLNLPFSYKNFTSVAKKSLEYLNDSGDLSDEEKCCYHLSCYRKFTDINKIKRAMGTSAPEKIATGDAENIDIDYPKPEKVPRITTRRSFGSLGKCHESRSSNVLPDACLICKKKGPIYVTDNVSFTPPFFRVRRRLEYHIYIYSYMLCFHRYRKSV
jgi:hypothetical protein